VTESTVFCVKTLHLQEYPLADMISQGQISALGNNFFVGESCGLTQDAGAG
jgi:hypothetical protein